MKVLQVSIGGLGNGGVQSVIMNISKNITNIHFDVLIFTNEKRYYDDKFKEMGGRIFRIPHYEGNCIIRKKMDYFFRFFRIFFQVYKLVKQEKYDVIHCHNEFESGICNLAAYLAGVEIRISHAHTSYGLFPEKNMKSIIGYPYKKMLQKIMNKVSNVKIGCSEEAFISLFGKSQLNNVNSSIVPNSIDLDEFKKAEICKNNTNTLNILHVGRFDDNKNQLFIIDLLPYILKQNVEIKLTLVGYGDDYKDKLRNKINHLNLEMYVEFLPPNSDVKKELENANIFVFPSKKEGFGITLLEAQAMEVPCIVSDNVPKIVNCGLCRFVPLRKSKNYWTKQIINTYNNNHNLYLDENKLNKFDVKYYSEFFDTIYRGKIYEDRNAYFSQSY